MVKPRDISVILPVYNAEKYLAPAIESVLNQSFTNFELIIINDGSTDGSKEIILSYKDPRIVFIDQANQGLSATLNTGITLAKGEFIARQDADDLSLPGRFQKQLDFLKANDSVFLLGTRARIIDPENNVLRSHHHPTAHTHLLFDLVFNNPFVHSSVMIRKKVFEGMPAYSTNRNFYEDYELWSRIALKFKVANLPETLLDYRHHTTGISTPGSMYYKKDAVYNQNFLNAEMLGLTVSDNLKNLFYLLNSDAELYRPEKRSSLLSSLEKIKEKLSGLQTVEPALLEARFQQYKKLMNYRLVCVNKKKYSANPLLLYYTMFKQKLFQYPSELIND